MIFEELVNEACERLGLASDEAKSRVGRELQNRYRRVTSGIGLETSRRAEVSKAATTGSRTITFTGVEKILAVFEKLSSSNRDTMLTQITVDQMHITSIRSEPPRNFAITGMHSNSVDVYLDCIPATTFTLYADGETSVTTLSGGQAPDFPESFHEILIFGAMADEYRRMEKLQFSRDCENDYEKRLSDLRMWIAKSAYLDIHQGRYIGM